MYCRQCGQPLAAGESVCPRCSPHLGRDDSTRRLPNLVESETRHLVQLEQCPQCKWIVFPGDAVCSACGAAISRVSATRAAASGSSLLSAGWKKVLLWAGGVALALALIACLFYFLRHI